MAINPQIKDKTIISKTRFDTALSGKVDKSVVGQASGVAGLDTGGKVPATQMPSADAIAEGTTNRYYTDARALAAAGAAIPTDSGSINFSGNVGGYAGIRFTAVAGMLRDSGTQHSYYRGGTVNADLWWCDNAGIFVTKGDLGTDSDERLKTNWRDIDTDQFIRGLAGVLHGIYDRNDIELTQVGVGAQSLEKVAGLSYAVRESEGGIKSVSYGQAALVACVKLAIRSEELRSVAQQQNETIAHLLETVKDLQARVVALESK